MNTADVEHECLLDALWQCLDAFPGFIDRDICRDYLLTLFFFKAICDERKDYHQQCLENHPDQPEMGDALMRGMRFMFPAGVEFRALDNIPFHFGAGARIDRVLNELEVANPDTLRGLFDDIHFTSRDLGPWFQASRILGNLLDFLDDWPLDLRPSRFRDPGAAGRVFSAALEKFASVCQPPADQYPTQQPVARLMARLLDPQPDDAICDPACGSGGLLIACADLIVQTHGRHCYRLYGQETNFSRCATARMNLLLHRMDKHRIAWGDTLRDPQLLDGAGNLSLFDIVLAAPHCPTTGWRADAAKGERHGRFALGVPSDEGADFAFILHMLATLKPETGCMAVLLPHAALTCGGVEGVIRQKLIEAKLVDAVIGLPRQMSGDRANPNALLIMRRKKVDEGIVFVDASRDGHHAGDCVARVCAACRARKPVARFAKLVPEVTVGGNGFHLDVKRYVAQR